RRAGGRGADAPRPPARSPSRSDLDLAVLALDRAALRPALARAARGAALAVGARLGVDGRAGPLQRLGELVHGRADRGGVLAGQGGSHFLYARLDVRADVHRGLVAD